MSDAHTGRGGPPQKKERPPREIFSPRGAISIASRPPWARDAHGEVAARNSGPRALERCGAPPPSHPAPPTSHAYQERVRPGCLQSRVSGRCGSEERSPGAACGGPDPPPCVPATARLTYMKGAWALSGARPPKQLSLVERLRMREGLLGQPPAGIGLHLGTLLHRAACWRKYSIVQIVT